MCWVSFKTKIKIFFLLLNYSSGTQLKTDSLVNCKFFEVYKLPECTNFMDFLEDYYYLLNIKCIYYFLKCYDKGTLPSTY